MSYTEKYLNYDLSTGDNDGSSEENAWQTFADAISGAAAGDRVNVKKASSRVSTGDIQWTKAGTQDAPIHIRAYETTIGDGGMFEMNNRFRCSAADVITEGIDIVSNTTLLLWMSGNRNVAYRCRVEYANASAACCIVRALTGVLINCYIKADVGSGYVVNLYQSAAIGCYFEATDGATTSSGARMVELENSYRYSNVVNCIFKGNGDADLKGINIVNDQNGRGGLIQNNVFEGMGTCITYNEGGMGQSIAVIQDNIFYNATKAIENLRGTNSSSKWGYFINNNATGLLTGAAYTNVGDYIPNQIVLTESPFIDTTHYELNDAPGGGALCKFRGTAPNQLDPSLKGPTFAYDRDTGRVNFTSISGTIPKGAESSHVF
jgi:hypothetical protein